MINNLLNHRMNSLLSKETTPEAQLYNQLITTLKFPTIFGGAVRDLLQGKTPSDIDIVTRSSRQWYDQAAIAEKLLSKKFVVRREQIASYGSCSRLGCLARWKTMEQQFDLPGLAEYYTAMTDAVDYESTRSYKQQEELWKQRQEAVKDRFPNLVGTAARRKAYQEEADQIRQSYQDDLKQLLAEHGLKTQEDLDREELALKDQLEKLREQLGHYFDRESKKNRMEIQEQIRDLDYQLRKVRSQDPVIVYPNRSIGRRPFDDLHLSRCQQKKEEMEKLKLQYSELFLIDEAEKTPLDQELLKQTIDEWLMTAENQLIAIRLVLLGPKDHVDPEPVRVGHRNFFTMYPGRVSDKEHLDRQLEEWEAKKPVEPQRRYVYRFPEWYPEEEFQARMKEWMDRQEGIPWTPVRDKYKPVKVSDRELFDPAYVAWLKQKPQAPKTPELYDYDEDLRWSIYYLDRKEYEAKLVQWEKCRPAPGVLTRVSDQQFYQQQLKAWNARRPHNWHSNDPVKVAQHQKNLKQWEESEPVPGTGQISDVEFFDKQQLHLDANYQRLMTKYHKQLEQWEAEKPVLGHGGLTGEGQTDEGRLTDEEFYQQQLKIWQEKAQAFWETPEGQLFGEDGYHVDVVLFPRWIRGQPSEYLNPNLFDYRCNTLYWDGESVASLIEESPRPALDDIAANQAVPVGPIHAHRREKMLEKGWTVADDV